MPPQNSSSKLPKEGNVVKKTTLYLVYFVAFLDLFAVSMLTPLLRKQSLDLGSSYTTAGLLGSVYGATQLFSSPFIGDW
jgi:predicted MFS family arabinose efflux permease